MKLNAQLAEVESAFAGARIRSGTISAGYNHVIPSQPTAKKELKRKRKRAATMPEPLVPSFVMMVRIIYRRRIRAYKDKKKCVKSRQTIENDMPVAPNIISCRLPNFSMVKTAIQEARKYSTYHSAPTLEYQSHAEAHPCH